MRGRVVPLVVLVVAVILLIGSGVWAAARYDDDDGWGPWSNDRWSDGWGDMHDGWGRSDDGDGWRRGPGTMGSWGGGVGVPGDGRSVDGLDRVRERSQEFADRLGLRVGEVMLFSRNGYAELTEADGTLATEVLVDLDDGSVALEHGPAMMWNTAYGMHPGGDDSARISPERARELANDWLDDERPGVVAGEADAFPGYYTLHTLRDGAVEGMLSVHTQTGDVWYHGWHGRFVAMEE